MAKKTELRIPQNKQPTDKVRQIASGLQVIHPDGTRHVSLTLDEREGLLLVQKTEEAVALFLDVTTDRSNAEIAAALEISTHQLKRLTMTEMFKQKYEDALLDIGHSPRLALARQGIDELFPAAVRTLAELLRDSNTPAGVRLKAATSILEYADIKGAGDNRDAVKEFSNFLAGFGATNQEGRLTISMPVEYAAALSKYTGVGSSTHTPASEDHMRMELQPVVVDGEVVVLDP
jgi:hypothetical protein